MKKFYRFAALILTGVLALSVLVGCSSSDSWEEELKKKLIGGVFTALNAERADKLSNDEKIERALLKNIGRISGGESDGWVPKGDKEVTELENLKGSFGWVLYDENRESPDYRCVYALAVTNENCDDAVQMILKELNGKDLAAVGIRCRISESIDGAIYVAVGYTPAQ